MPLTYASDGAPSSDPIDLDELKTFLRIGSVDDYDDELNFFIGALCDRNDINNMLQWHFKRQLIEATLVFTLPEFHTQLRIPRPPLIGVTSVEYRDENGDWQTVSTSNYQVNSEADPGFVRFLDNFDFPDLYENDPYPVRLTYTAGYKTGSSSTYAQVPYNIRAWGMNILADMWRERKATVFTSLGMVELKEQMARIARPHMAGRNFG